MIRAVVLVLSLSLSGWYLGLSASYSSSSTPSSLWSASPWLVWYFSGTVRSTFGDFSIAPVRNQVVNSQTTLAGSHLDLDLDSDLDAAALAGVALLPSKNRIDSTLTLTPISSPITYIRDQWTLSIGNRNRKRNWKPKPKIKIKNQKSKTKL